MDHFHLSGTLRTQPPFLLAVQLWASYQSFVNLSFLIVEGDNNNRLPLRVVTGFKREHTHHILSTALGTESALINVRSTSSGIVSMCDFIYSSRQLDKEWLIICMVDI